MVVSMSVRLLAVLLLAYSPVGFGISLPTGASEVTPPAFPFNGTTHGNSKVKRQRSSNLPGFREYITAHDARTGESVFWNYFPGDVPPPTPDDDKFTLLYSSDGSPINMANYADVNSWEANRQRKMDLVNPRGLVIRYVDFEPSNGLPIMMHRTLSLDYGVLMEGELDLVLDSGQTKRLRRGDVAVQRGTSHAWRNPSSTNWARMLFVMQASQPLVSPDGSTYSEEYNLVPASS